MPSDDREELELAASRRRVGVLSRFKGHWEWCWRCNAPIIRCSACGNTSCNGGGCEVCDQDFEDAIWLVNEGVAPSNEEVEFGEL